MTVRAITDLLDTARESVDEFTRDGGTLDRINKFGGIHEEKKDIERCNDIFRENYGEGAEEELFSKNYKSWE